MFRALSQGFTHWASGRLSVLEINTQHPNYCHVHSTVKPSMKAGTYQVYVLLWQLQHVNVLRGMPLLYSLRSFTCTYLTPSIMLPVISYTCIFHRKCASCTHVSALLQALVAMTPTRFLLQSTETEEYEEALPVTSYACQWKAPRKRKESNLPTSEGCQKKSMFMAEQGRGQ